MSSQLQLEGAPGFLCELKTRLRVEFPARKAVPAVELGNHPRRAQVSLDALSKQLHSHEVSCAG